MREFFPRIFGRVLLLCFSPFLLGASTSSPCSEEGALGPFSPSPQRERILAPRMWHPTPCDVEPLRLAGFFEVGGGACYWMPCLEPLTIAQISRPSHPDQLFLREVKPNFHLGYHLHVGWVECRRRFIARVEGIYLFGIDHARAKRSINQEIGLPATPILPETTQIDGRYKIRFRLGRAYLATRAAHCPCSSVYFFAGGCFLNYSERERWVQLEEDVLAFETRIVQAMSFQGGGGEAGFWVDWKMGGGFSLNGSLAAEAFLGNRGLFVTLMNVDDQSPPSISQNATTFISGLEVKGSLRFALDYCWVYLEAEIGYWQWSAFDLVSLRPIERNSFTLNQPVDRGFLGPYVSFALRF